MPGICEGQNMEQARNWFFKRASNIEKIADSQSIQTNMGIVLYENGWYCQKTIELHEKLGGRGDCQLIEKSDINRIQRDTPRAGILLQRGLLTMQLKLKQEPWPMSLPARIVIRHYRSRHKPYKRMSLVHNIIPLFFMR